MSTTRINSFLKRRYLHNSFSNLVAAIIALALLALPHSLQAALVRVDGEIQEDLQRPFNEDLSIADNTFKYQDLFSSSAEKYELPLAFILAIARGESNWQADAISSKGAIGLMQLMPATAKRYGYSEQDLYSPEKNIDAGTHYLSDLYKKFQDPYLTAGAYYCGEGAIEEDSQQMRSDCNDYVHYIHTHFTKVMSQSTAREKDYLGTLNSFVLAEFEFQHRTEKLMNTLSGIPGIKMDIFRSEKRNERNLIVIRYQLKISYSDDSEKNRICKDIEEKTAFDLCR